jgi:putative copper resistance protein D
MALDMSLAQRAVTVVLNLAVAVAVGAVATRLYTARLTSPWARLQDGRAHGIGVATLAVAILASICGLWLAAAGMAEVPLTQAGRDVWTMLTATHLGTAWQVGMAALLVSIAAMALASRGRREMCWTFACATGIAAFLYTRSMVSHASDGGDFSLIMIVDWVHFLLISLWVGEVIISGLVVLPSLPGETLANRTDCSRYVESLSTSATVALVGIFATGLFNAWTNLGSPRALIGNAYGTTLLIKLTFVLSAAALGGLNRFFIMPGLIAALRTGGAAIKSARQFTMILRIEAILLVVAMVMAAVLSSTSPPSVG